MTITITDYTYTDSIGYDGEDNANDLKIMLDTTMYDYSYYNVYMKLADNTILDPVVYVADIETILDIEYQSITIPLTSDIMLYPQLQIQISGVGTNIIQKTPIIYLDVSESII